MTDLQDLKNRLDGRESGILEMKRHSSVLIPFVERDGRLCLLFEQRSAGISQPGEVCFPGGRMEEGETPEQTALREILSEIEGLHESRNRDADREHRYFTCKNCKAICRVPAGKGRIVITCPKCGAQIKGKS